jgi:hypothetical protein
MTDNPHPETQDCDHPIEAVKVVFATASGSFSAICLKCRGTWQRRDSGVPPAVLQAVYAAAGMSSVSAEEAARLGLYTIKVGDPYLPPSPLKEGLRWTITPYSVQCGVYWPKPPQEVVDGFHTQRIEFALTSGDHALMLSARFGHAFGRDVDWMDGSWQATWLDRYPNPALLVSRRAEITCRGGAATATKQPEWQLR